MPRSPHKPSPAEELGATFDDLMRLLASDWRGICDSNLGVLPATAVAADAARRRLLSRAARVQTLAASDEAAADRLAALAARQPAARLDQLQALLDAGGREDLADFVRLSARVGCVGDGGRSCPVTPRRQRGGRGAADGTAAAAAAAAAAPAAATDTGLAVGGGSSKTPKAAPGSGAFSSRQRRAGGIFASGPGMTGAAGLASGQVRVHSSGGGGGDDEEDPHALRFARLLPPGHLLVKIAEELQRRREFEAALAAGQQRMRSVAGGSSSGGGGGGFGSSSGGGGFGRSSGGAVPGGAALPSGPQPAAGDWDALRHSLLALPGEDCTGLTPRAAAAAAVAAARWAEAGLAPFAAPRETPDVLWARGRREAAARAAGRPATGHEPLAGILLAEGPRALPAPSQAEAAASTTGRAAASASAAAGVPGLWPADGSSPGPGGPPSRRAPSISSARPHSPLRPGSSRPGSRGMACSIAGGGVPTARGAGVRWPSSSVGSSGGGSGLDSGPGSNARPTPRSAAGPSRACTPPAAVAATPL